MQVFSLDLIPPTCMATLTIYDAEYNIVTGKEYPLASLVNQVKKIEKKNFPRFEALDFDMELKKRSTELAVVLDQSFPLGVLIKGYLVWNRLQKAAFLHKICVAERYRRGGIARQMILRLEARLRSQGCTNVQLWVDDARAPAKFMYQSLGFSEIDRVEDYYSPGRTGIKMKLDLQNDSTIMAKAHS